MSRTKATPDVADIASQAEAEAGTSSAKFMTPQRTKQAIGALVAIPLGIACSDETTALTAGNAKATYHMPFDGTLVEVIGELVTPQTSGNIFTVDVNEAGASLLSTKLTIDNGEETSLTAATPAVISDTALAKGAKLTFDIDQIGDGTATGLKVWLMVKPTL